MGYAWLRLAERTIAAERLRATAAIAVASVAVFVGLITVLVTRGHDALPVVMQGGDYSLLVTKGISPAVWLLTFVAMAGLWRRELRAMDLWLMLVMWIWLFDIALAAVIGSNRFDLGFYSGRIFGLIAASFLLAILVIEMARLYAGAIGAASSAEQRLSEFARLRSREGEIPGRSKTADTVAFAHRQNVAHYEEMLRSPGLSEQERRSISTLLAEEQTKLRRAEGA